MTRGRESRRTKDKGLGMKRNVGLTMTRQNKKETTKGRDSIVILMTAGSEDEAHKIAKLLVNQKKAACVNVVPGMDSLFRWEGKLDSGRESLLLVKTKASLLSEIISLVKTIHSYEVPEIIALPIIAGNEDYLKWLDDACQ
jgi:periplasmic divalent cation tolerance protein